MPQNSDLLTHLTTDGLYNCLALQGAGCHRHAEPAPQHLVATVPDALGEAAGRTMPGHCQTRPDRSRRWDGPRGGRLDQPEAGIICSTVRHNPTRYSGHSCFCCPPGPAGVSSLAESPVIEGSDAPYHLLWSSINTKTPGPPERRKKVMKPCEEPVRQLLADGWEPIGSNVDFGLNKFRPQVKNSLRPYPSMPHAKPHELMWLSMRHRGVGSEQDERSRRFLLP